MNLGDNKWEVQDMFEKKIGKTNNQTESNDELFKNPVLFWNINYCVPGEDNIQQTMKEHNKVINFQDRNNNIEKYYTEDSSMWLQIVMMGKKYGKEELLKSLITSLFAVDYYAGHEKSCSRRILHKLRKNCWEILDEKGTKLLDSVKSTDNNYPISMWGEIYTAPSENSVNISLQLEKKENIVVLKILMT